MYNQKRYYKILSRDSDGILVSPFAVNELQLQYVPYKRTIPTIGKLYVYSSLKTAIEIYSLINKVMKNLEIWECKVDNPKADLLCPIKITYTCDSIELQEEVSINK